MFDFDPARSCRRSDRSKYLHNWALSQETHTDQEGNPVGETRQLAYADPRSDLAWACGNRYCGHWIVRLGLDVHTFRDTDDEYRQMAVRYLRFAGKDISPSANCISE